MKTKETSMIDCTEFSYDDYPTLTTDMYVECYNGMEGKIDWVDFTNFGFGDGIRLHVMDIEKYRVLTIDEMVEIWRNQNSTSLLGMSDDRILELYLKEHANSEQLGELSIIYDITPEARPTKTYSEFSEEDFKEYVSKFPQDDHLKMIKMLGGYTQRDVDEDMYA